jgi:hypothetical protein
MNPKLVNDVSTALGPWISAAFKEMQPDAKKELAKCLFGPGEVRCVFYTRAKIYATEAVDYDDKTVTVGLARRACAERCRLRTAGGGRTCMTTSLPPS